MRKYFYRLRISLDKKIYIYIFIFSSVILIIIYLFRILNFFQILVLFLLLNIFIDYLIYKEIFVPLKILVRNLANIARGDFNFPHPLRKKNEIGILLSGFKQIFLNLRAHQYNLEERIKELSTLTELSKIINSVIEIEKLFPLLLKELAKIMKVEEVILFILNNETKILEVKQTYGVEEERKEEIKFKLGEGIAGWVCEKQEGIFLNNPSSHPHFKILPNKINSLLCVPLIRGGESIGVISLANRNSKFPFNENDLKFLTTLSSQIAISIENAYLYQQAVTDELTNLYIHRYFKNRLKEEIKRATRYKFPLSLLMLDIDYFKKINDTYGHQCGDFILQELANIIKNTVREVDIPARYGGEEFSVILPETDLKGAEILAERLRKKVEENEFIYQDKILKITVSIGVSILKENILEAEQFIEQADLSLYNAKKSGRNKICSI